MKDRTSFLIVLFIASGLMGLAPNAALGTSGEGGPCPTGGNDCAPVPHNENYSVIVWDIFPIGSWSIGRCTGVDSCKCNNGEGIAAFGVVMVPKSTGSGRPVFICQDKDYYYWENGNDGFCGLTGMEHGSTGDPELGDLIDFSVPGTTPLTGTSIQLTTQPAFHCPSPTPSPWQGEPTEAAQGYVHVYEVNLEATPQGNGAAIEWSITQFSGSASGDVTPNHLMLKVTDGVNEAVGGPYSGWSGSETWDGNWAGGGSWDGCGQVTISLEVAPNPPTDRYGIPSIIITDEFCGTWEYYNQQPGKSICFPCPSSGGDPSIEVCSTEPEMAYVCPGCCFVVNTRVCPLGEPVTWEVDAGPYNSYVQVYNYGASGGICLNSNFPPVGEFTMTISGYLTNHPGERVDVDVTVWTPHPSWPCTNDIGSCWPDLTTEECLVIKQFPCILVNLVRIRAEGENALGNLFAAECRGDCTVGNAFLHAYVNCAMTKSCSAAAAEAFWTAHEKKCPSSIGGKLGTTCNASIMDLHNNSVGRSVGQHPSDCNTSVWNALTENRLTWSTTQNCCNCSPVYWESNYTGQCIPHTTCD